MFFYLSKIFWFFAQPLNFAIFLLAAGLVASLFGWRRLFRATALLSFLVLALATWTSLGSLMLNPLEERFPRPPQPARVDGIVVLGGGFEGAINLARGGYELNSGGDRMVETAVLARRYPDAKVVISGGTGTLVLEGEGDADTAPRLLEALGVSRDRMILEGRSRNTYENAVFSKEMVTPKPGETWLLVTSAFHMPRSMALFAKAGFQVVAWPVDYRTSGQEGVGLFTDNPADSLQNTTMALREWIGLFAYWLSGRIDEPFPGPGL
ncbi:MULTISPECIES: YdcF family protein [Hyphomicrobiales]|uniref:YdcF family protein n=1 Tax=Hyphomicrobiales TaxID=356 RepID=UPI0003789D65|nr:MULTISPECIES: YdcF family protein [Phyllobacteriaceae]MCX8569359.1 YdcF family protein [Aminobacter sp. MET-1]